ncbi:histidine kinase [Lysobacter sp. Root916]|uniref:ATP-binding protein n=1 Tax=Lysobacter sp. Root916 TaxID=1736606 RepID=UPI00070E4C27|nr:ATP-binding protein [Lysobacter sp. Root916]KRD34665.1 histidine kinase [Lysobacter sp. Root916]
MGSIRNRLLGSLLGGTTAVLLVAAFFSYRAGLQEAGEMFDAKLAHSARVLMSLVDEPLADLAEHPGNPIEVKVWHGNASGVGDALAFSTGHAYETKLAFQVRDATGKILLLSDSGPRTGLAPLVPGYGNAVFDGEQWRTFTLKTPAGRWYQSAEQSAIRSELAEDIAFGTMLPLLLALPVLALLVWLAVSWVTRTIQDVSDAVALKDPRQLEPIVLAKVPTEVHGIVQAINGLLSRLNDALLRERRFTADVAHELRTPLAALKVHAFNVRQAPTQDERAQSQGYLDDSIERMERLVSQMLMLSRLESRERKPQMDRIDLSVVGNRHFRDYSALAAAQGKTLTMSAASVSIFGEELAIDALMRNLLDNALRYSPAPGAIALRVSRDGDSAVLVVEDSGPGIAEDARARVFERFYRELGTGVEGSGLGLSIVAEAVSLHRAQIAMDRSPELGGLRVTVTFAAV